MKDNEIVSLVCDHFDALSDQYEIKSSARNKYLSAINRLIVEKMTGEGLKAGKVLDVGCGTGTRTKSIFSALPMIEIYGSDISPKMLAIAKTKGLAGLVHSDMRSLPF
ncbi:methyltransferase domain-containing protein [Patescibacteria group bacterium]|nr:methyltransferase domain-containing protein [Patescibacteria group bacterium]MBU4367666.1 methyltransferase domain-containing protein [Patescibacteria group bacterium]MBU4461884.1 methyltransferase domain-containing protein [Patescibacteria group bacterium]MCG2699985.1 methyltransferase domain-containing protein [Candidatus Parcubacteria bacterium]